MRWISVLCTGALASAPALGQQLVGGDKGSARGTTHEAGYLLDLGDFNGDGFGDFMSMGRDRADIYWPVTINFVSGRDGTPLRPPRRSPSGSRPFEAVTAAGDVDGDGVFDYAVTMRDQEPPQLFIVQVCSGADDRVLWQVTGPWGNLFGYSLLGGVDLNGDGRPDLVLTVPRYSRAILAYDHRGTLLWQNPGTAQIIFDYEATRTTLARIGDINGDGADDVVVGAIDVSGQLAGAVVVLSGRDGRILTIGRREDYQVGLIIARAGDMDGDGVPDIATGNKSSVAMVFSGRTGT
jgi:hypothetical protein